jgi:hypothetical protein
VAKAPMASNFLASLNNRAQPAPPVQIAASDTSEYSDNDIRKLSRDAADAIKKQEDAIRLRRQNKIAAKDLIATTELHELITKHYGHCVNELNERLDALFLKHNIPQSYHLDAWKYIVAGLNSALEKTLREVSSGKY